MVGSIEPARAPVAGRGWNRIRNMWHRMHGDGSASHSYFGRSAPPGVGPGR